MAQYHTFPTSCAVQILGGFSDGGEMPTESLALKHRLTIAVLGCYQSEAALKKIGFIKIGTFNRAHSPVTDNAPKDKLSLWVAGGDFKLEPQALEKEKEDGKS